MAASLVLLFRPAHHLAHAVELLAQPPPAQIQHQHISHNDEQNSRKAFGYGLELTLSQGLSQRSSPFNKNAPGGGVRRFAARSRPAPSAPSRSPRPDTRRPASSSKWATPCPDPYR